MAASNHDPSKLRVSKNKSKTKDKACFFFLMCYEPPGWIGLGQQLHNGVALSLVALSRSCVFYLSALQVASPLKVTSWLQDGCWSSSHPGHILGREEMGGKGACQLSQLHFKGDILGRGRLPSKKKATLAFISLTRICHGLALAIRERVGIVLCCSNQGCASQEEGENGFKVVNLSLCLLPLFAI